MSNKKIKGHNNSVQEAQPTTIEPSLVRTDLPAPFLDMVQRIRRAEPKREELVSLMNAGFAVMKEAHFEMLRRDVGMRFAETQVVVQKPKSQMNYGHVYDRSNRQRMEGRQRIIRATRGQLYTDKEADELG